MTKIGILDPEGKNNNPLNDKPYSDTYKKLAKTWSKFPAYENVSNTLNIIQSNQVILITSGTGSGKTVLIPKYVLHNFDYKGHIMVSLPKQIIAQSAAEYAALTLDVELGEQVGYKYKGSEAKYAGKNSNLLYATDGTIVARLLNDPILQGVDAVIIDEAHERKVQIDFMLYLLRNVLEKLSQKNKINYRNFDLYYFIEHSENYKDDLDDMDNAINMDTQLKFLNNYEIDVRKINIIFNH